MWSGNRTEKVSDLATKESRLRWIFNGETVALVGTVYDRARSIIENKFD